MCENIVYSGTGDIFIYTDVGYFSSKEIHFVLVLRGKMSGRIDEFLVRYLDDPKVDAVGIQPKLD